MGQPLKLLPFNRTFTSEAKTGILGGETECLEWEGAEYSSVRAQCAMANDKKLQRDQANGGAGRKRVSTPQERPFDMWLHKQLHAMYDEIAAEPLPDDLLNLIDRDAEKEGSSGNEE